MRRMTSHCGYLKLRSIYLRITKTRQIESWRDCRRDHLNTEKLKNHLEITNVIKI